MPYIAGNYTATYDAVALGQTQKGFDLEWSQVLEEITSDAWRGALDGVFQGLNPVVIRTILIEPDQPGVSKLIWPWSATQGVSGVTGRLLRSLAKSLVLTRCNASTSATPATITIPKAIIWKDKVTSNFENAQRKIPVVIVGLPFNPASASAMIDCVGASLYSVA